MKKKKIIIAVSIVLVVIAFVAGGFGLNYYFKTRPVEVEKDFSKMDLNGITNIMFVAHPDDDSLWGGSHLLKDGEKYLVVCITCGVDKSRVAEFENAMSITRSKYIMLGWPDKTNGEKDNWDTSRDGIKEDVKNILALKDWDLVVTHNPEGEYGHIHHKMTSSIVTSIANKDKLMYFGKYYKASILDDYKDNMVKLSDEEHKAKYDLLNVYKTQEHVVYDMFGHMIDYENWLSYEEWNDGE